ncbi:MAG TPA: UDP-N-acetylglucosamine--N-acetylmuramyl-(pentapeptide) pyrophosphoryl-undecaprenol N-acetylglucosamine transferase [Longimicrobium sp.]|nr:UDP-N-acetylglucosamine--N-acetylmuramyl-(pentapeptide) pyrophosphoryl-undecaprenol N-acetylglucosamine transferase [Longimicrobium sp.]
MSARVLFAGGGTGGHLYPALNLGDAVLRADPRAEVFFVGAMRGVESRVLPEKGVPHELLPLEPLRRAQPLENWRLFPSMFHSLSGLRRIFSRFKPDLVVGTGGYASGPAAAWALLRGVPIALQEQNSFPGFVTRKLGGRARQLHLAFPEARKYLKPGPRTEVFEYGNPIEVPNFSVDRTAARASFGLGDGTVCLVTGGSQGARAVNEALLSDIRGVLEGRLEAPPPGFEILWATGAAHFDGVHSRLGEMGRPAWVKVLSYIVDMPGALASADFAVARAGAMSLAELTAWGIPSILVPLPTAAANHQHHNAVALCEAGAALMVPERELGQGRLWTDILSLARDDARRAEIAAKAKDRGRPDAADRIAGELLRLVGKG